MTTAPVPPRRRRTDLIAFFAVLSTGIILIALGVPATSLAAIAMALATLYGAWSTSHRPGTRDVRSAREDDNSTDG